MSSFAERMKKSALSDFGTQETSVNKSPETKSEPKKDKEVKTASLKESKKALKKELDSKSTSLELERAQKELEEMRDKIKSLEASKRIKKKSFREFKAKTFRITNEHLNMLTSFEDQLPDLHERLEYLSNNNFLRAILDLIGEKKSELDFTECYCEEDILEELSKAFK